MTYLTTPIAPSEMLVDAPVTASLIQRMEANPRGMLFGEPGEPKITASALDLVLGEMALSDVAAGITGISQRVQWLWVDFGFRFNPIATAYNIKVQARFRMGAGAYTAYVDIMDQVAIAVSGLCMFNGSFWARPNSGSWRCTLGGKNAGASAAFDEVQLRLLATGASPTLAGGRMFFTGIHGVA